MKTVAKDLFVEALEQEPAAREAFLARACGDDAELHLEVQRMFIDAERADSFFGDDDGATLSAEEFQESHLEKEGDQIGPYKLLQQIGEGGFGSVWMAEQSMPISRRVALKVIKAGMDTKSVLARFEAERQAVAMMDHPNITKILDAGATSNGRPYFAMELVKGIPITTYCDEARLGIKERLALFGDVCSAINHAHQKGIIHRDIEQASLSELDVDTRADIYALGVLLYELLTGTPPFDARTLLSAGYDEMCRIIREQDPPMPSSRISSLGENERIALCALHQVEPGRLCRLVAGDLDWIIMKAIEKDRTRRYETANALAADLARHLASEPVEAAAPGVAYRFRKFASRNKVAIGVGVLIFVVLVGATGISTWQAIRATQAENHASELLTESKTRQRELDETISLLTESTDELTSHMRRFVIGTWDFKFELDEEKGRNELEPFEWQMFKGLFSVATADFSSQLEFKEDGTAIGSTTPPALIKGLMPHEKLEGLKQGLWELVSQRGKRTYIKVSSRGLGGIRQFTNYILTVVDSDTLQMEDERLKDKPFKSFVFKRVK